MSDTPEGRQHSALPHGEPCAVVIFGASGDLTKRKLTPALFHPACTDCLADYFLAIGAARNGHKWSAISESRSYCDA